MSEAVTRNVQSFFLDKKPLQQLVREQNERLGIVPDLTATPEKSQEVTAEALRRNGLRPEDNIGSCGIIAAREA